MSVIIDAHVTVGWVYGREHTIEDVLAGMDRAGITASLVSADPSGVAVDHDRAVDELLTAARRWPGRILPYAVANAWHGARAVATLERQLDDGCVAIKIDPQRQGHLLVDSIVEPILELAADRGVLVYATTGTLTGSPIQLALLAREHPQVTFIAGRSGRTDFARDQPYFLPLPNILADTSHDAPDLWMPGILALSGAQRVVFASDAPYAEPVTELRLVRDLDLVEAEESAVTGRTLLGLLGAQTQRAVQAAATPALATDGGCDDGR